MKPASCLAAIGLLLLTISGSAQTSLDPLAGDGARAAAGGSGIGVGARAMGMGGAYTALANDASAMYWNPAGLSAAGGMEITLPVGVKSDNVDVFDEASDLWDAVRDEDVDRGVFDSLRGIAQRAGGRPVALTAGALAGLAVHNVAVGGFGEAGADASLTYSDLRSSLGYEQVDVTGRSLWYGSAGACIAKEVKPGVNVGLGVRKVWAGISRAQYTTRGTGAAVTHDGTTDTSDDTNFAVDLGLTVQDDEFLTAGLMIRNLNGPSFDFADSFGSSSVKFEPCVNLGVAYRKLGITLAADLHNLLDANNAGTTFHLGAEKSMGIFALRAGLHDGDLGFGFGVHLTPIEIQVALDEGLEQMAGVQVGISF